MLHSCSRGASLDDTFVKVLVLLRVLSLVFKRKNSEIAFRVFSSKHTRFFTFANEISFEVL